MHCPHARMLWELILAIIGMKWVFPFLVRQTLLSWQGAEVGKKRKKVWKSAPLCLFWSVWGERNRVAFDNEAFSVYGLKSFFIRNFWSWSNVYSGDIGDFLGWWVFLSSWLPFLTDPSLYTPSMLLGSF